MQNNIKFRLLTVLTILALSGIGCKTDVQIEGARLPDMYSYTGIWNYTQYLHNHISFAPTPEEQINTLNLIEWPHAKNILIRKHTFEYKSRESLSVNDLYAITPPKDSFGGIEDDTVRIVYAVRVGRDTSFGVITLSNRDSIILTVGCKVYRDKDSLYSEDMSIKSGVDGSQMILAKMKRIDDSIFHGEWLIQDTTRKIESRYSASVNINKEETPNVYYDIADFLKRNHFSIIDTTPIVPIELLDTFAKEISIRLDDKGISWSNMENGVISTLAIYFLSYITHIPIPNNLPAAVLIQGINTILIDLWESFIHDIGNTSVGNSSWDQFWNDLINSWSNGNSPYPPDLPPPPFPIQPGDGTEWWWWYGGQHGG